MSRVIADPPIPLHHRPTTSIDPRQAVEPYRVECRVLDDVLALGDIAPDLFVVWPSQKDGDDGARGFARVLR
ncbi:MAG: hypothetical protein O9319_00275 [Gemmatimonas sp.]|uniref:hypothetical protein n=1 Tax=Gemmatimonas sp. TaxID=1962908 RepID=UPI0022C5BB4F|nr:hypothetical protein [Gemmatimonas sp.]MCZ8012991.1 hypothetical protein [Gemmatimonas sp.]MCZ8265265.1 hypothetical protein [Gemmatimonas sp.]